MLILTMCFTLLCLMLGFMCFWDCVAGFYSDIDTYTISLSLSGSLSLVVSLVLYISITVTFYFGFYIQNTISFQFYSTVILCFMLCMFILVVSSNWTVLVLSWEGLGLTSFFLVNFSQSAESHNNSVVVMLTMRVGDYGLFLILSCFFYSSYLTGVSLMFNEFSCLFLLLLCSSNSAMVPFSGWLPKAISAPTPTSALVHSSTLVTAGVCVLVTHTPLTLSNNFQVVMFVLGYTTMLFGSMLALFEINMNKLVAFSTLSQIGVAIMVCGCGTFVNSVVGLLTHGLANCLLFLQVGYLIHVNSGQQFYSKWGDSSSVHGCVQIQVLISLTSLSGVSFFSGIVINEAVLNSIYGISIKAFLLLFLVLSIYITFIYSVVIYKSLFGSFTPVVGLGSSFMVLVSTFSTGAFAIVGGTWLSYNTCPVSVSLSYVECYINLLVLVLIALSVNFLTKLSWLTSQSSSLSSLFWGKQTYGWLQLLLSPVDLFESFTGSLVYEAVSLATGANYKVLNLNVGSSINTLFFVLAVLILFH